jgi:hypothetical protein
MKTFRLKELSTINADIAKIYGSGVLDSQNAYIKPTANKKGLGR